MNTSIVAEALKFDVAERILIVEDIWDSIAEVPHSISITESEKKELERRLDSYHKNKSQGTPWDIVKARILQ